MKAKFKKMKEKSLEISEYFTNGEYVNREYSALLFNKRVLKEAEEESNPLLERCNFLKIFESNLCEFYQVRVGKLKDVEKKEPDKKEDKTHMTAKEQLKGLYELTELFLAEKHKVYKSLRNLLKSEGIKIAKWKNLSKEQKKECYDIFTEKIKPFLNVIVLDAKHPLPLFENSVQYLLYAFKRNNGSDENYAIIAINDNIDTLYPIESDGELLLVNRDDIIRGFAPQLLCTEETTEEVLFKVIRNTNFDFKEIPRDLSESYEDIIKSKIERRVGGDIIKVDYSGSREVIENLLSKRYNIDKNAYFKHKHYLDYSFICDVEKYLSEKKVQSLSYIPIIGLEPPSVKNKKVIETVRERDVLLTYPFNSMSTFLRLLEECGEREDVISIQITIYRLAEESEVVRLLKKACLNGKKVTAVIEITARFDEENNITVAKELQEVGCNVIYGIGDLKVHCKTVLITLKEGDEVSYITHIGTGNYNEQTSRQYTDYNILTGDKDIGEDISTLFRALGTGDVNSCEYKSIVTAPRDFKSTIMNKIDEQITRSKEGKRGYLFFKMNGLSDTDIIEKLLEAERSGVKICLIVRGICCLSQAGHSDNLKIISIVGRFLEHSRVYIFGEEDDREVYISSADLMTRNMSKRIELGVPIKDKSIAKNICEQLNKLWITGKQVY